MDGCTIFVRLWQYREGDSVQLAHRSGEGEAAPLRPGVTDARLLFDDGAERVTLEDWAPGASVSVPNSRGLEMLVVSGSLRAAGDTLEAETWQRLPAGRAFEAVAGADGARVWIKDAPLQHPDVLRMPG